MRGEEHKEETRVTREEEEMTTIRVFAVMFLAVRAWELYFSPLTLNGKVMLVSALVAVCFAHRGAMCAALATSCLRMLSRIPFAWDNEWWDLQTDAVLCWSLLQWISDDGCGWVLSAARTTRIQYALFYSAAGFWKLNSGFLDPTTSCATLFFTQHLGRLASVVGADRAKRIAPAVAKVAPTATIALELGVGVAMFAKPKLGAVLAFVLHAAISLTPKPNNISSFSAKCAARLLFFASPRAIHRLVCWAVHRPLVAAAVLPVYVAVVSVLEPSGPQDWATAIFVPSCVFVLAALSLDDDDENDRQIMETCCCCCCCCCCSKKKKKKRSNVLAVALAFIYSYVLLVLGLQDLGSPNMYSNLRLAGGPNHLLVPAAWWRRTVERTYGGVVRVEATTSTFVRRRYPADFTDALQPAIVPDLLAASGYLPATFFHPAKARVLRTLAIIPPRQRWVPFTVLAFEFRRLISEATAQGDPFEITYARLPGDTGDEVWRSTSAAAATITASFDAKGLCSNCSATTDDNISAACDPHELVRLPPLPYIARKFTFFLPYPVLDRGDGPPPHVPCIGP
ncbi:hypothetical protein CTAYLR_000852 [Chrysophaeum taylorii]|uniref:Uncharacterized protein n=1 Tax=Chrysophaeum taylorii TaxID=2483200 RepID=A0AAD7XUU5_9STRA|nr:hypothetical protein CTAYLR_000852 [Chrysophaeum taylorii]